MFSRDDRRAETILWCIRPEVALAHLHHPLADEVRALRPAEREYRMSTHHLYNSFLVATSTINQRRAVEPLFHSRVDELELEFADIDEHAEILAAPSVRAAERRLKDSVEDALFPQLEYQLHRAVLAIEAYERMELAAYAGVLVATQHAVTIRALIAVAHLQGVPVVYVPHAPAGRNEVYFDLPVSRAGLRGPAERDFYAKQLHVRPDRLDVIGNLATDVLGSRMPGLRTDAPGVVAVSPHPEPILRQLFEMLLSPELGPMMVAPHPASNLSELREMMPDGWELFTGGRTLDLLREGPPFMLHLSSGVAWESSALGIPTATVRLDDSPLNYPFLDDRTVLPVIGSSRDAVAFARRARAGEIDRDALRAHALKWCESDGRASRALLTGMLDKTAETIAYRTPMLHDGWSRGGRALQLSGLGNTPLAPKFGASIASRVRAWL